METRLNGPDILTKTSATETILMSETIIWNPGLKPGTHLTDRAAANLCKLYMVAYLIADIWHARYCRAILCASRCNQ